MPERNDQIEIEHSSVSLLIAAGVGTLLFTLVAGLLLYSNTRSLVAAKDWVEHTQEVLTSVQSGSQLIDRIEFSTRLYALNKDEYQRSIVRFSAISLATTGRHLTTLVADNSTQNQNVRNFTAGAAELNQAVRAEDPQSAAATSALLRCREALSLLAEQERNLLKQRSQDSQRSSFISLTTEFVFIAAFMLTLLVLFGLLLRDAFIRRRISRQTATSNETLAASVGALQQRIDESRLLTSCRDELQLCVTVQQVYRATSDGLARLLPGSSGCISMINNSRHMVEVVSSWGDAELKPLMAETFSPEACCGLRLGQVRWRAVGVSEIDCTHFVSQPPERYLCVPIMAQGDTLGVLSVLCDKDETYATVQQRMDGLRQLRQLAGMAVASLNLRTRLENQSIRDSLTGLFNRHFMQTVLQRELARASRHQTSLAVFMLDVDHFKRFNDTHGHGAGDTMLKCIAEVFLSSVRTEDTVCRYGGEEFAIILPGITPEAAYNRAQRIREAVTHLRVPLDIAGYAEASVSIGIAFHPGDRSDGDDLLRKADQALYRAKHAGRNQVLLAEMAPTA